MNRMKSIGERAVLKQKIYELGSARASVHYKKNKIDQMMIVGKKEDVLELLRQIVEEEQLQEADMQ